MPAHPEQILAWIHRFDEKPDATRGNKYQVRMSWETQGVPDFTSESCTKRRVALYPRNGDGAYSSDERGAVKSGTQNPRGTPLRVCHLSRPCRPR